jgi:hypothetical protein
MQTMGQNTPPASTGLIPIVIPAQHDSFVAPHTKPLVCAPDWLAVPWQLDCAVQLA